jgi:hypothetical protein
MGTIKLLVGFLAIVGVAVAAFQIAPPLLTNYSFQDDLQNVAMVDGGQQGKTEEDVRTDVLRRAKDRGLAIEPKQVTVQNISTPGLRAIYVAVDYTVPVNLPGYSFDMHFTPTSGNKGF